MYKGHPILLLYWLIGVLPGLVYLIRVLGRFQLSRPVYTPFICRILSHHLLAHSSQHNEPPSCWTRKLLHVLFPYGDILAYIPNKTLLTADIAGH